VVKTTVKPGSAANLIDNTDVGITWGKGIQGQGMPGEDYLATQVAPDARLPVNFKTFDFYDRGSKVATSAKTLDTQTAARINNPEAIYGTLKGYVDDTVKFETYTSKDALKRTLESSMIKAREIQLAIPSGTTSKQWAQISRAVGYAQSQGIKLIVTEVK
jgi:filamentous hemagglutinin